MNGVSLSNHCQKSMRFLLAFNCIHLLGTGRYWASSWAESSLAIWTIFLLWSQQYFSGDLNNISLAIWTIFIWWSKGDFSGDLNTISLVILTISPYDLNYNFLAIWTLFIWWSRQYLFLDSSHLSLSHFWVHFRALIWYDINEHNSQCKSAKYGENPCWRIWKQYIGWKKRVVRLLIKFDHPYWGFGHTDISPHQDKSYDRQIL